MLRTMIVTRFAPSPTGYLHLGHAFAALFAHDRARRTGGAFRLRLEDIDTTRVKPEFAAAILEDLRWLGLSWDGAVVTQSERVDAYRAALGRLDGEGLLYPCFCTRSEIAAEIARASQAPHGPEGALYPGTCRHLPVDERARRIAAGAPYALRLDAQRAALRLPPLTFSNEAPGGEVRVIAVEPQLFGDVVLARKETPASYHLAVVIDDAFQGVTLVTRGEDLLAASHVQRVLQALLGLPEPAYAHHRLILDAQGRKFSKRDDAVTLRALRAAGETPSRIRAWLA